MPGCSDYVLYIIEIESEGLVNVAQNIGVIPSFQAAIFVILLQTPTSCSVLKTLFPFPDRMLSVPKQPVCTPL